MSVAEIIETKRNECGWSKAELARRLKVTHPAVINWTKHGVIPKRQSGQQMEEWWGLASGTLNGKSAELEKPDAHELHPNQTTGVNQKCNQ